MAQGGEVGGHGMDKRATFTLVPEVVPLVPEVVDLVAERSPEVPLVVAAGGVADAGGAGSPPRTSADKHAVGAPRLGGTAPGRGSPRVGTAPGVFTGDRADRPLRGLGSPGTVRTRRLSAGRTRRRSIRPINHTPGPRTGMSVTRKAPICRGCWKTRNRCASSIMGPSDPTSVVRDCCASHWCC